MRPHRVAQPGPQLLDQLGLVAAAQPVLLRGLGARTDRPSPPLFCHTST
jgi:hypothetical protein